MSRNHRKCRRKQREIAHSGHSWQEERIQRRITEATPLTTPITIIRPLFRVEGRDLEPLIIRSTRSRPETSYLSR